MKMKTAKDDDHLAQLKPGSLVLLTTPNHGLTAVIIKSAHREEWGSTSFHIIYITSHGTKRKSYTHGPFISTKHNNKVEYLL